jgi:inosine/xanthosine triphosphatase
MKSAQSCYTGGMKKVIVASENPVKVAVAKRAFAQVYPDELFEFVAVKSESGVSDQPMNEETECGAENRLQYIQNREPVADFWISQEGGVYEDGERLYNRAWIAVCDKGGYMAKSSTALFYLPPRITQYIREGMELGVANDTFFNSVNSKQGIGAIGHLTDGLIDREAYYTQAAIIALSELKHQAWYRK